MGKFPRVSAGSSTGAVAATSGTAPPAEGTIEETAEGPVEKRLHDVSQPMVDSREGEAPVESEDDPGPFSPEGLVPRRPSRRRSFSSPMVRSARFPSVEELRGTQDVEDLFEDGPGHPDEDVQPGSKESPLELSPGPEIPVPRRPSRPRSASPADVESAPFPSVEELRGTAVTPEVFEDERDRSTSKSPRFNVSGFGMGAPKFPSPVPEPGRLFASEERQVFPKMGLFATTQTAATDSAAPVDDDATVSPADMERMEGLENMDWATEILDGDISSPSFQAMGSGNHPTTSVPTANTIPGVSGSRPDSVPGLGAGSNPIAPHPAMKPGPRNAPDLSFSKTPQGGWLSGFPPILPPRTMPAAVPHRRLRRRMPAKAPQHTLQPLLPSEPGSNISSEFGRGRIPGWGRLPRFSRSYPPVASGGLGAETESVPPVEDIPDFCISDVSDVSDVQGAGGATDRPPSVSVPPFATAALVTNSQPVASVMPTDYFSQDLDIGNIPFGRGSTHLSSEAPCVAGPSTSKPQSIPSVDPLPDLRMGNVPDLKVFPNLPSIDPELTELNTVGVREVPCLGCLVLLINWTM